MTFAAKLRERRLAAGLTVPELAARLRVSPGTVWGWERGTSMPLHVSLEQFAAALGTGDDWLAGLGGGDPHADDDLQIEIRLLRSENELLRGENERLRAELRRRNPQDGG